MLGHAELGDWAGKLALMHLAGHVLRNAEIVIYIIGSAKSKTRRDALNLRPCLSVQIGRTMAILPLLVLCPSATVALPN